MIKTLLADKYGEKLIMLHQTELLEDEAKLAMAMIEKWGMVATVEDGEDTTGRQKLRMLTPAELAERAFETAKIAMTYARKNGLVHTSVDLDRRRL